MRVLVTGDRFWARHELAASIIHRPVERSGPAIVTSMTLRRAP
jgi:hypothetical protein